MSRQRFTSAGERRRGFIIITEFAKSNCRKTFGVFEHRIMEKNERLVRGFEEFYYVPHSRHTDINMDDLKAVSHLKVLSVSDEAGVCLIASKDEKQVFNWTS